MKISRQRRASELFLATPQVYSLFFFDKAPFRGSWQRRRQFHLIKRAFHAAKLLRR
jgi:hypothetical protein